MAEARSAWRRWCRVLTVGLAVGVATLVGSSTGTPSVVHIVVDTFEEGELAGWVEWRYHGSTLYRVVTEGQNKLVMAHSQASASALGKLVRFDPHRFSHLEWRWKIDDIIEDGHALEVEANDHAAGVYVIFAKGVLPLQVEVIKYLWANDLPQGTEARHPTEKNVRLVAVESGRKRARQWTRERRNLVEDYQRLFGAEPPRVVAIAIMTDTDQTETQATAYYDDLILRR